MRRTHLSNRIRYLPLIPGQKHLCLYCTLGIMRGTLGISIENARRTSIGNKSGNESSRTTIVHNLKIVYREDPVDMGAPCKLRLPYSFCNYNDWTILLKIVLVDFYLKQFLI